MESKLDARKGPEWHGCEACHGPGKDHVEGGGDKTKFFTFKDAAPADTSSRCLRCHQYDNELRKSLRKFQASMDAEKLWTRTLT
jgi:hypothetical protein